MAHKSSENSCQCHSIQEYLAESLPEVNETRRAFLRKIIAGGVTAATLPTLLIEEAKADILKPSAEEQKKMGEQAVVEVLKKYKEVKDDRAKSFARVGERLIDALPTKEQDKWNYSFRLVESKDVNAFALPGGAMFMFTGLIDRIQSADELAGVTAHEVAHVRAEHWAIAYAKQRERQLIAGLIIGLTRTGKSLGQVAGLLDMVESLRFGRKEEYDADKRGIENMLLAKYDPEGIIDLFNTLQKASGGKEGGPEFLRSHPLTKDRIKKAHEQIAKQKRV